jgi:hypothetical protein
MSDGLEPLVLAKAWLDRSPGDTVRVDHARAKQMRAEGYEKAPAPLPKGKRKRKEGA